MKLHLTRMRAKNAAEQKEPLMNRTVYQWLCKGFVGTDERLLLLYILFFQLLNFKVKCENRLAPFECSEHPTTTSGQLSEASVPFWTCQQWLCQPARFFKTLSPTGYISPRQSSKYMRINVQMVALLKSNQIILEQNINPSNTGSSQHTRH